MHDHIQIYSKYGKVFEDFIGPYYVKRFRNPIFTVITKGNFDKYVRNYLRSINNRDYDKVNRTCSLMLDMDPLNYQKRINIYHQEREFLLKLASNEVNGEIKDLGVYPQKMWKNEEMVLTWNISRDFDKESIPNEI